MNDRARAKAILKQARDLLAERLTERVLEVGDEILEDAAGFSYMGEIDSVYEQIGAKLLHVSQMISNLPAEPQVAADADSGAPGGAGGGPHAHGGGGLVEESTTVTNVSVGIVSPALPAPTTTEPQTVDVKNVSFQTFAAQIQDDNLEEAGHSLALLFDVTPDRGVECARVFAEHLSNDPQFLRKAIKLRHELIRGGYNAALLLLFECFGLTGMESIGVLQTLKARLSQLSLPAPRKDQHKPENDK